MPVCCIYHKPRAFDESSSESSASDDDDRPSRKAYPKGKGHALKKRDGAGGHAEESSESESSESEGGGGDGSARCVMLPDSTQYDPLSAEHDSEVSPNLPSDPLGLSARRTDSPTHTTATMDRTARHHTTMARRTSTTLLPNPAAPPRRCELVSCCSCMPLRWVPVRSMTMSRHAIHAHVHACRFATGAADDRCT